MTANDIRTGGPTGAPDFDVDDLVEQAFRTAKLRAGLRTTDREVTASDVAEEVRGIFAAKGCMVVTPMTFVPKPVDFTYEAYGVALAELGEDGDSIIALGHIEPRRMLAAMNRYWRKYCGMDYTDVVSDAAFPDRPTMTSQVKHRWAEFTRSPADSGGEFDFAWMCWPAPPPHLDVHHRAVPITRWEL
ncbi:MAG: hypothetical protein WBD41_12205 [Rhodococcus sp. (in: high G+C Gram-positive bacteria)]